MDVQRARRSCLSVPGSSEKILAKAPGFEADELVFDLEDAVAPEAKDGARARVLEARISEAYAGAGVAVRVNGPGTPWCHEDLIALAGAERSPQSVIVPKVETAGDLAFVDRLLDGSSEPPARIGLCACRR
jgi:citrate lyase subunit beta/citryl-CoA lyase